jgi:hypothetical protein
MTKREQCPPQLTFYISQIERDFSEDVCIPGSGGSVGLI